VPIVVPGRVKGPAAIGNESRPVGGGKTSSVPELKPDESARFRPNKSR
jgi:hypothetical protein